MGGSRAQGARPRPKRSQFVLSYKRLEMGKFKAPFDEHGELSVTTLESAELGLILEGIELAGAKRRARWEPRRAA